MNEGHVYTNSKSFNNLCKDPRILFALAKTDHSNPEGRYGLRGSSFPVQSDRLIIANQSVK